MMMKSSASSFPLNTRNIACVDTSSKSGLARLFCLACVGYLVLLLSSVLHGPAPTRTYTYSAWNCPPGTKKFDALTCPDGVNLASSSTPSWSLSLRFVRPYDRDLSLVARPRHLPHTHPILRPVNESVDAENTPHPPPDCARHEVHCYLLQYSVGIARGGAKKSTWGADISSLSDYDRAKSYNVEDSSNSPGGGASNYTYPGQQLYVTSEGSTFAVFAEEYAKKTFNQYVVCRQYQQPHPKNQLTNGITECEPITLVATLAEQHYYSSYTVTFTVLQREQRALEWLGDVEFELTARNESFAIFQCVAQFGFLTLSLIALVTFLGKLSVLHFTYWTAEQRWTVVLLATLIGFNDPLFVVGFLRPYRTLSLLTIVLKVTFYWTSFLYCLVQLEGIAAVTETSPYRSAWRRKIWMAGLLWAAAAAFYISIHVENGRDVFFVTSSSHSVLPFHVVQVFFITASAVYILYLARSILRVVKAFRLLSYRYKLLLWLTLFILVATITFLCLGSPTSAATSASGFMVPYMLLNAYVLLLAVLFAPSAPPRRLSVFKSEDEEEQEDEQTMRVMTGLHRDDFSTSEDSEEDSEKLKAAWETVRDRLGSDELSSESDNPPATKPASAVSSTVRKARETRGSGAGEVGRRVPFDEEEDDHYY